MEQSTTSRSPEDVPKYHEFMWPALQALRALGYSGSIQEMDDKTAEIMHLSDSQLDVLHGDGPKTKVAYRLGWARTYLKHGGAITNTSRGIWSVTPEGSDMSQEEVARIPAVVRAKHSSMKAERHSVSYDSITRLSTSEMEIDEDPTDGELRDGSVYTSTDIEVWRNALLDTLLTITPDQFERLCQRLLRESGFTRVRVTG